jgi:hypothetical protein
VDSKELNGKEKLIIEILQCGDWVDKETVLNDVWGTDSYFVRRSFEVYCSKLKRKGYNIVFNDDNTKIKMS